MRHHIDSHIPHVAASYLTVKRKANYKTVAAFRITFNNLRVYKYGLAPAVTDFGVSVSVRLSIQQCHDKSFETTAQSVVVCRMKISTCIQP